MVKTIEREIEMQSRKIIDMETEANRKRLDAVQNAASPPPTDAAPSSGSSRESATLDDLARAHDAQPVADVAVLLGGWPGSVDDGFEEAIHMLRHADVVGD